MESIHRRIVDTLWARPRSAWSAWLHAALQIAYMVARDFLGGQLTLRAMSLVYTTLLSLVPMLAVSFSILKAFGVHKQVEPLLGDLLEPLGPKGAEVTATIIGFVDNLSLGVLGAAGFAMLFFTAVSVIHKVEVAFNEIWHVERNRSLVQRFSQYLTVALFGPVLIVAAMGITASVSNSWVMQQLVSFELVGSLVANVGRLVPYLLAIAAFALLYAALPNTKVRLVSALTGGIVAGLAWQAGGWLFASFVAGSTKYAAIYAGFAIVIIAMIWIYYCWVIVLFGSTIAFYHQHPEHRVPHGNRPLSIRATERLALRTAAGVGQRFQAGRPAPTLQMLARDLNVPRPRLEPIVTALELAGILKTTEALEYLPARALDAITVVDVLDAVRDAGVSEATESDTSALDEMLGSLAASRKRQLDGRTVMDLLS